ncbi:MAG: peptide deformylase [Phycisphaerae bacterium]|nr:peptide deformylase [Phycisphaerae bacterium]
MKDLGIRAYPDPILRARAEPLAGVRNRERRLLMRMLAGMRRWHGVGLAAPQVGLSLRLVTVEAEGTTLALANPTILDPHGADDMVEGCLSLPGTEVNVRRAFSVWVRAIDNDNRKRELKLQGLLARIVQHEIDHLDGVLITDHGPPVHRAAKLLEGRA